MTVRAWRIGSDTPEYTADDMSGTGARLQGGRWNRVGTPVVYSASSRALACLETVVHFNTGALPLNRYLVEVDIPDDVWAAAQITSHHAAALIGWDAEPAGRVSVDYGEAWVASGTSALLLVPSVIIPEESNILINPQHPDVKRIQCTKVRKFVYDHRLTK